MKFDEWLFLLWFGRSKKPNSALVTYHIYIGQRAIGLPMGGLDSHMSQHCSPHDEAQSLLNAEAALGIKSKITQKSILFVSDTDTTESENRLPIRLHVNCVLAVYDLETWSF